jgi:hypothetical protein
MLMSSTTPAVSCCFPIGLLTHHTSDALLNSAPKLDVWNPINRHLNLRRQFLASPYMAYSDNTSPHLAVGDMTGRIEIVCACWPACTISNLESILGHV